MSNPEHSNYGNGESQGRDPDFDEGQSPEAHQSSSSMYSGDELFTPDGNIDADRMLWNFLVHEDSKSEYPWLNLSAEPHARSDEAAPESDKRKDSE